MMNRWSILAVLFLVRCTMGFQFQAIATLSPMVMSRYGIGLTELGLLIGLYLSPGIALAIPGGALGQRAGEKRAVIFGLALMTLGGVMAAMADGWELQFAARLIAGTGGVILNVLMSKMVTDWFAGREIATAMAIFVNSWPVGIALALLILPPIAAGGGLDAALWVVPVLIAAGMALFASFYRPAAPLDHAAAGRGHMSLRAWAGIVAAGLIWGLYNSALLMIFGFGPTMLTERGWSLEAASSTTSIVLWVIALSVPVGGILADRLRSRDGVLAAGLVLFALVLAVSGQVSWVTPAFILLGLVAGLSAGPIMSLPADFLAPETRGFGMGIFFALYYATIAVAPVIAGRASEALGTTAAAFPTGSAMLLICLALLGGLRAARRIGRTA